MEQPFEPLGVIVSGFYNLKKQKPPEDVEVLILTDKEEVEIGWATYAHYPATESKTPTYAYITYRYDGVEGEAIGWQFLPEKKVL